MSKTVNDSYIIGRLITTAYLHFSQWNYPTTTSFDFISRSPINQYEMIDVTQSQLNARCSAGSSCAIIIGVVPIGPGQNTSVLTNISNFYNLTFLGSDNLLDNGTVNTYISRDVTKLDFYWFIINNNIRPWRYLVTAASTQSDANVDLYLKLNDG